MSSPCSWSIQPCLSSSKLISPSILILTTGNQAPNAHMPKLHKFSKIATSSFPVTTWLGIFLSKPVHTSNPPSPPSHQQITELILDQKTPSLALQTFKWASALPNFTHSLSTYRALVAKLCAFRRFDTVHQLLYEMPGLIGEAPDDAIFITIVKGLARARMVARVVKVLDLVSDFGKTPSLKVFNSILDVLVQEDIDLAREFYRKEMMANGVKGDGYTFGILMKGLCLTNRIADGFTLLQVIKSTGSKPNTVVYNTLLHALCKNGKIGRARSLMNEMEQPNDVTFNILISGYCKEDNLVQALVMLEKSFSSSFVPDNVSVTKLVEGLCNAGRVADAAEVLNRVESKEGKVDVVAYNTLIKGLCRTGKVKVGCGLLKEMERKGYLPNIHTYNALISGLCESEMLDSALDLFNDMQTDGINANFFTYDALIRGLFSGGKMEDGFKMLELMEGMKGGAGGRICPYNNVLYGFYKKNLWREALEYLLNMQNLFPRAVGRSLKVLNFCERGAIDDAKEVYIQMIDEGGSPSAIVYDCLIHGLCQGGRAREAVELVGAMVGNGFLPVASTFNSIISEFCRQGKDASALMFLEDIVGRGCVPDAQSYCPIIRDLCRKREFVKAAAGLSQMVERGTTPDELTWNSLLLCLSQKTNWSGTNNLFRLQHQGSSIAET